MSDKRELLREIKRDVQGWLMAVLVMGVVGGIIWLGWLLNEALK